MVVGVEQIRVLVASTSPYTRYVISGELSEESDLFVVGTARTPDEIAYKQELLRPDLLLVDLQSPRELSDLRQVLSRTKGPVLAMCAPTQDGAELAFAALNAGVVDVVACSEGVYGLVDLKGELVHKVRGLARAASRAPVWEWDAVQVETKATPRRFFLDDRVVVVSASAGGLVPLLQLLTALPADLDAALLVLTSFPAPFLPAFARRANATTPFHLRPAREGASLRCGVAYLVPTGFELSVESRGYLELDRCLRWSDNCAVLDTTLTSLATRYGPALIAVLLSGMGRDGVDGARNVRASGGEVIVQAPETCLANDLPSAVVQAQAATSVLPPEQIGDEIVCRVKGQKVG